MDAELLRKINVSIQRLQAFCPDEGYYLAFSGGKDSIVCKKLLEMSGCKFDAHYRVTSVDPPELVQFIKNVHGDVARNVPHYKNGKPITMWNLIPKKMMLPTRINRYCCAALKEDGGDGRKTVTGVRWYESKNRKDNQGVVTLYKKGINADEMAESGFFAKTPRGGVVLVNDNEESRRMVEQCYKRSKTVINPIIEWTDQDVWDFIKAEKIPYCQLYNEGFKRLGCIGCPMASKGRFKEFARWPKYKQMYKRAIKQMIYERQVRGLPPLQKHRTVEDLWHWWMEDGVAPGQIELFSEEMLNDGAE